MKNRYALVGPVEGGSQFWQINDTEEMFALVSISVSFPNAQKETEFLYRRLMDRDTVEPPKHEWRSKRLDQLRHVAKVREIARMPEDRAEQPINFDSGISANLTPAIHSAREVEIEIHVDPTSQSALDRIFSYPGPHCTETGWQWRDQPCVRPNPLANYHGPNLDDLRLERAGVPSPTEPAFIDDDDSVDADIDWSVD